MKTLRVLRTTLAVTAVALLAAGCKNDKNTCDTNPTDPSCSGGGGGGGGGTPGLGLAVAVRYDQPTFASTGEFDLLLVPSKDGAPQIDKPWTITSTLTAPTGGAANFVSQQIETPDTRPFAAALLVDNSSSMSTNDKDRVRATAAQQFWQTLFQANTASRASLLWFGLGGQAPSAGFTKTRILQTWTSNAADLTGKLDTLHVGTGSQLYTSATEVAKWMDSTTSKTDVRRVLVLLTDGSPDFEPSTANADQVIAAATAANVKIYTVGLGDGSDRSQTSDATAVALLQKLANSTGGLYAGVATASQITPVLQSLASSGSTGVLVAHFKLSPVPASGTAVKGTVTLKNPTLGTVSGDWSFTAP